MRKKVKSELANLKKGMLVEVNFIDACRCRNVKRKRICENKIYATYKHITGEYFGTLIDKLYEEPFFVMIVEGTNGKVDTVSIPETNIQKVTILERKMIKEVSRVGDPMLAKSYMKEEGGIGEVLKKDG